MVGVTDSRRRTGQSSADPTRVWTVYEHGGGRTVSSEQIDDWKPPLLVVPLARAEAAEAEAEKWKRRTRAGVRTPPPGYESGYVEMRRFAAVCAERDRLHGLVAQFLSETPGYEEMSDRELRDRVSDFREAAHADLGEAG